MQAPTHRTARLGQLLWDSVADQKVNSLESVVSNWNSASSISLPSGKLLNLFCSVKRGCACAQSLLAFLTLCDLMGCIARQAPLTMRFSNAGVGCHALLQGFFPTQGSNVARLRFSHRTRILYRWATRKALEWGYQYLKYRESSLVAQMAKRLPAMRET